MWPFLANFDNHFNLTIGLFYDWQAVRVTKSHTDKTKNHQFNPNNPLFMPSVAGLG